MPEKRQRPEDTEIVVIVPAAGKGLRFGKDKVFIPLQGKPVLYWAVKAFEELPIVKEIIPVLREEQIPNALNLFEKHGLSKIKRIAPGGERRQDSVFNALSLIEYERVMIMIHDGARPLVSKSLVERVVSGLGAYTDGVIPVVPLKDTVKEVKKGRVVRTLSRDRLVSVQTPQLFPFGILKKAYIQSKGFYTDDAQMVEQIGGIVKTVEGDYKNIKITTPEDIKIAELFLPEVWD